MVAVTSDDDKLQLYEGASVSQLSVIFEMDKRKVAELIRPVSPSGKRMGYPVYSIKDAAPYLSAPVADVEAWIKKLRPNDLPPLLSKEFWLGQLARQKYEKEQGDLWDTEEVKEVCAEAFKRMRSATLLFADTVEQRVGLTDEQRKIIQGLSDNALDQVRRVLLEGDYDVKSRSLSASVPDSL